MAENEGCLRSKSAVQLIYVAQASYPLSCVVSLKDTGPADAEQGTAKPDTAAGLLGRQGVMGFTLVCHTKSSALCCYHGYVVSPTSQEKKGLRWE